MVSWVWVVVPAPVGGELAYEFELGRDVDELVAERGIDDPAHEGPRLVGIEHIGIGLQRDAQVLRLGAEGAGAHQDRGEGEFA
jgi:hypothetical protein